MSDKSERMISNIFCRHAVAIDISAGDDEAREGKAFYLFVGTGGDVTGTTEGGDTVAFKNLPDGYFLPVLFTEIADSSTATDMLACWS